MQLQCLKVQRPVELQRTHEVTPVKLLRCQSSSDEKSVLVLSNDFKGRQHEAWSLHWALQKTNYLIVNTTFAK